MRRLYVTKAGYWYVFLTIAMGVVALMTGNNVFYLMECLLLGGMILSGVISERAIRSVELQWQRKQARADAPVRDLLQISNPTRFAFFCLEFGEWKDGRFDSLAFVTKLGARSNVSIPVSKRYERRGVHSWDGLADATAAPFGFARKVRIIDEPGSRVVWPEKVKLSGAELRESQLIGGGTADAEIRPYELGDDARGIVWKLSAKGTDPVVRKNRLDTPQVLLTLNLGTASGRAFEETIREVASSIYQSEARLGTGVEIRLKVLARGARRTVVGRVPALNFLATAQPVLSDSPGAPA